MTRKSKEFIREGNYAAEVSVELIEDDTAWSPYLTPAEVHKLDTVRLALRRGDLGEAAKHGRVFELTPNCCGVTERSESASRVADPDGLIQLDLPGWLHPNCPEAQVPMLPLVFQ